MRRSTTQSETQIKHWNKEDVYQWLLTEVKVQKSCADTFTAEEVSGDYLVEFTKKDILDLGIKHGPAVKITSYLQTLKDGSMRDQIPAYLQQWTKDQVKQWLLQHVKVYSKYAELLKEEDVSGDCLACFEKQDFLDLGVKSGPVVKILAELRKLRNNPEPSLQIIPQNSTEQEEATNTNQAEAGLAQAAANKQPQPYTALEDSRRFVENESEKANQPFRITSEVQIQHPRPQNLGARRKEDNQNPALPDVSRLTLGIQKTLEDLQKEEFKKFQFYLTEHHGSTKLSIPRGKLEGKDTMDTAKLITKHYEGEALKVTLDSLRHCNNNQQALELKEYMGQKEEQSLSKDSVKTEVNQGEKLKNLLTCGGNSLDNYDNFVVVVNKSSPEQVQYLQFLNKLKLFCVLDFDPNSNSEVGLCHSYRVSDWANLHTPSEYQGEIDTVIKKFCRNKQTSWVFCNGRHDLEGDSYKELDYKNWLRRSCRDVEQVVSFICNPEVLLPGRSLIIFLLISPVDSEKDPIFDTYKAFLKNIQEEEIIIHICESKSTYEKWRDLIRRNFESDIHPVSVYELSLREVNGTVMALGPLNNTSERLLPSSDSSYVVLSKKDEAFLPALDILCLNQCENTFEENSPTFLDKKLKVEEEFYRGGKVSWWNFFFCDKDKEKPFIKRDKYKNLKKMIRNQLRELSNMCVLLNLFHSPGCGGTTLAMHVLWELRQEVRCAVLLDKALPKTEVAVQVFNLMKLESKKPFPVLLLVDDSKETENTQELVNCISRLADTYLRITKDNAQSCKVIILNCVRSHNPKEQYRRHNPSQYITASLKPDERKEFEKKLEELKETHERPENFYSFMIMKSNFSKEYINDLAHNSLENFNFSLKNAQLFAFLALFNAYVADSQISLSLCKDFLGMKTINMNRETAIDRMEPYSNLLIMDSFENWEHQGIRIIHHSIASACLKELERSHSLKASEITLAILHCDLLFSDGVVKQRFMESLHQMLIEREPKKNGPEREIFSRLISDIHSEEEGTTVKEVFMKASSRFDRSAPIPQALARYLYIKENDFPEALKWAEKAKNMKENPFTFDTIGEIHKSNLKFNTPKWEKEETSCNLEELSTNLKIATNAISAFKKAQELANAEEEPPKSPSDEDTDDYPRKSYNIKGYVGMLEIAFLVFNMLKRLPFFDIHSPLKRRYFLSFLQKAFPITSVHMEENENNYRYQEIIKEHEHFLQNLKTEVKGIFEHLNNFYTYMKGSNLEVHRRTVFGLFKNYVYLFCTEPEEKKREQRNNSALNLKIVIEEKRLFLEKNQADMFSGILQYLDKPEEDIESITESYAFLQQHQQQHTKKQMTKETTNYILSNIVLNILNPHSKLAKSQSHLSDLLLKTLQDIGMGYSSPEPYFLAMLLFWPSPTEGNTEVGVYVRAIRKPSRKLTSLFGNVLKSTVAYLYLGKGEKLKRLVSKPQLDKNFNIRREYLAQLWRSGEIFKEQAIINILQRINGTIEQGEVFAVFGQVKIPVRPALIGSVTNVHSTEKVSFCLGFAINGPLAYDIQYEN